jgi:hypothetical protein
MFRHGVRATNHLIPTDPYDPKYWSRLGGLGELTPLGQRQMNVFGAQFAKYYQNKLKKPFMSSLTFARSTLYNRTILSSSQFLDGLFGNNTIKIVANPMNTDNVI